MYDKDKQQNRKDPKTFEPELFLKEKKGREDVHS